MQIMNVYHNHLFCIIQLCINTFKHQTYFVGSMHFTKKIPDKIMLGDQLHQFGTKVPLRDHLWVHLHSLMLETEMLSDEWTFSMNLHS
jgi:hypothetical protein